VAARRLDPLLRLAALGLLALSIIACGQRATGLPTHRDLGGGPTALLSVDLEAAGACVYGVAPDGSGRWLIIWPAGFGLRDGLIVDGSGSERATIGESVQLTGGEYHATQFDFIQSLLESPPDPSCTADEYFLATEVE
jgi:hypothetical protein